MDELRLGPARAASSAGEQDAFLRGWQVGQVLRAQVIDSAAAGGALLRIAGRQVAAATDIFLPRGAWLELRVTGLEPLPTVRILKAPLRARMAPSPLERQTLALLPRQGNVIAPLRLLLEPGQSVNFLSLPGLPKGLSDPALAALVHEGPPRSPEALQRALAQSGLFYEAGLAQRGAQAMPVDLKAVLFRLRARIDRAHGERLPAATGAAAHTLLAGLAQDVQGALATISLNQLTAARYAQEGAIYWVFHVPFVVGEQLHPLDITLGRERLAGDDGEEAPREWKALLQLSLPQLGELECEVYLRDTRVSVVLYAARVETQALLDASLGALRGALAAAGLEPAVIRVHAGLRGTGEQARAFHAGLHRKA